VITREQVADLQPGDVIRMESIDWPTGTAVAGPLQLAENGALLLHLPNRQGSYVIREANGSVLFGSQRTIELLSRAPRPLYVNHPRMGSVPGDVVRPADGTSTPAYRTVRGWLWPNETAAQPGEHGLTLLVNGETGQVVP